MTSKTHRKRRTVGRGRKRYTGCGTLSGYNATHDPIHLLNYISRQSGGSMMVARFRRGDVQRGMRRRQRGRGIGSLARTAFKRDEYGKLLFKDPRHV